MEWPAVERRSLADPVSAPPEVAFARRLFADNGWPVIDMTRRSIEEAAAAIIGFYNARGIHP